LVQKYGIHLKTKEMDPESLKNHPYVLIRHGLSKFNLKALIAKEEHGPDSE
jgi:hypothetical protein